MKNSRVRRLTCPVGVTCNIHHQADGLQNRELLDVEIVINSLGQVHEQGVCVVPDVLDRMIGKYGKHKVSAGGVDDSDITGVVHDAVPGKDVTVFVRHERAIWNAALNERAEFILGHEINQNLTGARPDFIWKCGNECAASILSALINICKQDAHFRWRGL